MLMYLLFIIKLIKFMIDRKKLNRSHINLTWSWHMTNIQTCRYTKSKVKDHINQKPRIINSQQIKGEGAHKSKTPNQKP